MAAVAGSLYAHTVGFISPEVFDFSIMINTLLMVIGGGLGTVVGPVVGAILFTQLPEFLRFSDEWRLVIYGAILVILVRFLPRGLCGYAIELLPENSSWFRRRRPGRQPAGVGEEAIHQTWTAQTPRRHRQGTTGAGSSAGVGKSSGAAVDPALGARTGGTDCDDVAAARDARLPGQSGSLRTRTRSLWDLGAIRRPDGHLRRKPAGEAGPDHRSHRPQRCRQVDGVQRHDRIREARQRNRPTRRA